MRGPLTGGPKIPYEMDLNRITMSIQQLNVALLHTCCAVQRARCVVQVRVPGQVAVCKHIVCHALGHALHYSAYYCTLDMG